MLVSDLNIEICIHVRSSDDFPGLDLCALFNKKKSGILLVFCFRSNPFYCVLLCIVCMYIHVNKE